MKYIKTISILIFSLIFLSPVNSRISAKDKVELIGIKWCGGELVNFNPHTGKFNRIFNLKLKKNECFRGLAYDSKNKKLYALSQVNWNLYSIDLNSRKTKFVGKLNIDESVSWGEDIGGLTYDPVTDTLYTAVSHWDSYYKNIWSELVTLDLGKPVRAKSTGKNKVRMIEVKRVGLIACAYISSVSFNKDDNLIYAFAVDKSGNWDSQDKSRLVTINPENAVIRKEYQITVQCPTQPGAHPPFPTKVHTILGLALTPAPTKPQENIFYSWINWDSHFYARCDLDRQNMKTTCTCLKNSDLIGVNSDAMLLNPF